MRLATTLLLLAPMTIWGQPSSPDTIVCKKLNDQIFELKFALRVLPDNGWFLKLHDDSTYEYVHWSGWGNGGGTVLEHGTYTLNDTLLKLKSEGKKSDLFSRKFYLTTSEIFNEWPIDCDQHQQITYCLYRR